MLDTLPPKTGFRRWRDHLENRESIVLVVLWSLDEPRRVGEIIRIDDEPGMKLLGRGEWKTRDGRVPLQLHRQWPGLIEPTGPLRTPTISREQLHLELLPSGRLAVTNVGRCPLLHNGIERAQAEVAVGDLLELQEQLLLLCLKRPEWFPAMAVPPLHNFGHVDAHGLVGESLACWELRSQLAFVAPRNAHVLVQGASGTGKELVARAIHVISGRRGRPMVSRNAATFPESLIDAELFGNAKNYPNPGMADRPGLVGEADGSTLFLDEFGELPAEMQAHLLRVLDQGEYQRLGESTLRRADFRLVAATNRPESDLKHDILARLKLRITLPDLNARREDIPLIARHLLRRIATEDAHIAGRFFDGGATGEPRLSPALISFLVRRTYTTHVRELEALLWRSIAGSRDDYLDLSADMCQPETPRQPEPPTERAEPRLEDSPGRAGGDPREETWEGTPWEDTLEAQEAALLALFRRHRFNVTECSRDPACPVERATADLYLRVLMLKGLKHARWDLKTAAGLVVGSDDAWLHGKVLERLETTLENFRQRLAEEGEARLREKLARYYRSNYPLIEATLEALLDERL